jgi:hypothetical protein
VNRTLSTVISTDEIDFPRGCVATYAGSDSRIALTDRRAMRSDNIQPEELLYSDRIPPADRPAPSREEPARVARRQCARLTGF